jgi:Mg2+-importing ATPase
MLALGPVSSVFDFLTFYVLLAVFHSDEVLFHTGWFIESVATQVLVIFVIRTRGNPFASRPNPLLVVLSLAVVAIAAALPWTPVAPHLGFTPPPPSLYAGIAGIVVTYLLSVSIAKSVFYRYWEHREPRRGRWSPPRSWLNTR